jgi:hypothetical protein
MAPALLTFGVVFAALCVWLTVRILNRKERWAKRTLAAVIGVPLLYVASFGPWCWVTCRFIIADEHTPSRPSTFYHPILWMWFHGPMKSASMIDWYANLFADGLLIPGEGIEGGTYPEGTMTLAHQ